MPQHDADTAQVPTPLLFGVAGTPQVAASSLSPRMFAAAFEAARIEGAYYVPLPIREKSAHKALRSLARLGFRGANVTMPFKPVAAEIAHTRSELVERIGVANVLVIDETGQVHAEATDGQAVVEAIAAAGKSLQNAEITVLGAGGAAAEAAFACAYAGAGRIRIWNRHEERARELRDRLQGAFPALDLEVARKLPISEQAHVLVSAVPRDAVDPAALAGMREGMVVVDLAYRPDRQPTALMEVARDRAATCVDGLEILVRQGAASFRLWFDAEAPTEVMDRAVR